MNRLLHIIVVVVVTGAPLETPFVAAGATISLGTRNNASSWLITGGGATAAPAFQTSANHSGEISLTSDALPSGSLLPGGSLAAFNGLWFADRTFVLPTNAVNITLTFDSLYGNDRVVLQLNGTTIGDGSFYGAIGPGVMRFPGSSHDAPFTFYATTSGRISSGLLTGTNTLRLVVNNTGKEPPTSTPTSGFVASWDATDAFLNATVSYELAEPPYMRCVMQSNAPVLQIYGRTNSSCEIQSTEELVATYWTTRTNILLTASPYVWVDLTASNFNTRFYRVVQLR